MRLKVFLLFVLLSVSVQGQDVIFSQGFLVPETLNTSFTGAIRAPKLAVIHKSKWRNTAFKTTSNFVHFDNWIEGFRTGIGISILNQVESGTRYTFNQVNLNYSISFQLNHTWFFRPSISVGYGMKNYGFQNILLEDQINITTNTVNTSSIDPVLLNAKRSFFDFSSSLLFNNDDSWLGITVRHLNKPNISLTQNGNSPLDIFWSVHSKYYLPLLENFSTWLASKSKLYVLANFMKQADSNRFDIGFQYVFDNQFAIGVTAATVPIKSNEYSTLLNSVNSFMSLKWDKFRFGYSYDMNTTKLSNTGGVHEFSIGYDFSVNRRGTNRLRCVSYF